MIIMSVFFFAPLRLREKNYFSLFGRSPSMAGSRRSVCFWKTITPSWLLALDLLKGKVVRAL